MTAQGHAEITDEQVHQPAPRGVTWLAAILCTVAGAGVFVLMVLTVADVASREFRGKSINGAIEISEVALVAVVFLGMASAQLGGQHVSSPVVTSRVSASLGDAMRLVGLLLSLGVVIWMIQGTWSSAMLSIETNEVRYGLARVPVWPAKLAIPIGLGCMGVVLASQLMSLLMRRARQRVTSP